MCDGLVPDGEKLSQGGIIERVGTTVDRLLPSDDDGVAEALLELTREIATKELFNKTQWTPDKKICQP